MVSGVLAHRRNRRDEDTSHIFLPDPEILARRPNIVVGLARAL
jgi:hypothetical protein